MDSKVGHDSRTQPWKQFLNHWTTSTTDSNLTLHGFRRFKTTHLLNLRFIEAEIEDLDRHIFQAGLSLNIEPSETDRLGLSHCKKDDGVPPIDETITTELVQKLRCLIKQYDDALIAFNAIMAMDTFALIDDEVQCCLHTELNLHEKYKTRLLRLDQPPRARQDPFQRRIHQLLRLSRYRRKTKQSRADADAERCESPPPSRSWSSQNTALLADIIGRVVMACLTGLFLTVPLTTLTYEVHRGTQLGIISACILAFACLVSVMLRASNLEMMVVTAAYAAILSVFVSNSPGK